MFEFHGDRERYFDIQVENTKKYVIPFIENYKAIKPGSRILEIGCGEAGVLKAFTEKGCVCVGIELDETRSIFATERMKDEIASGKISIISKDIFNVIVEKDLNGKFDIIILKDVIEHIHNQPKLIEWMKSFLNEAGVIFFGFPPWQMPFGGHQQIMRNRFLSKLPYFHLLPFGLYEGILKLGKENVAEFAEIKETRISIERFEKIVKQTGYEVVHKTHYLINPIYEYKFGWKPIRQNVLISKLKYIRNYFTTCVYYLISPKN